MAVATFVTLLGAPQNCLHKTVYVGLLPNCRPAGMRVAYTQASARHMSANIAEAALLHLQTSGLLASFASAEVVPA